MDNQSHDNTNFTSRSIFTVAPPTLAATLTASQTSAQAAEDSKSTQTATELLSTQTATILPSTQSVIDETHSNGLGGTTDFVEILGGTTDFVETVGFTVQQPTEQPAAQNTSDVVPTTILDPSQGM